MEEENDSDAASDADLSDADDQTNQELTRGTRIRDDFYPAEEQAQGGVNRAGHGVNTEEKSEEYGGREEQWESERGLGLNKWHIVAMVGCERCTSAFLLLSFLLFFLRASCLFLAVFLFLSACAKPRRTFPLPPFMPIRRN